MACVLLISLYDEFCLGARQLVSNLRQAGHECYLLCLKRYGKKPLAPGETPAPEWQVEVLANGQRSVLCYPAAISAREEELFERLLRRLRPQAVGLSVYSNQLAAATHVSGLVRRFAPEALLLWGGPHPTLTPESSAQVADFVVRGEADYSLLEIARALDSTRELHALAGVAWGKNGSFVQNPLAPIVTDLDSLPFACHDDVGVFYLDQDELNEAQPFEGSELVRTHKIMTSRGCPYACSYCMLSFQKEFMPESAKLRYRSIPHVIAELEEAKRRKGHFFLEIEDDIFTLRTERMEEFFGEYRARIDMPLWCYTHPQYAREKNLTLLRDNNVQFVVMGIESGSNRVATEVFHRKVNNDAVLRAAHAIGESGLRAYYDLITNNPFETEEDRIETFHFVRSLPRPFELQLVELNFFPNTAIDRMRVAKGLGRQVDPEPYRFWNALYHLAAAIDISDHEAQRLLSDEGLRRDPWLLEAMAGEARHLASTLAESQLRAKNLEREAGRQHQRAEQAEAHLRYITHRRGLGAFLRVSDRLRAIKRKIS